jgi:uncharacterized membrane protein YoaK (UPF0700 family)
MGASEVGSGSLWLAVTPIVAWAAIFLVAQLIQRWSPPELAPVRQRVAFGAVIWLAALALCLGFGVAVSLDQPLPRLF